MIKQKNEKLKVWSTKDIVSVVAVFLINLGVLFGLMIFGIKLFSTEWQTILYTDGKISPIVLLLFVLLVLVVAVLVLYFVFEERDFMRKSSNCEMIFLIIEVGLVVGYIVRKYVNIYLSPLALPALLALFLTNRKNAIIVNAVFSTLLLLVDSFSKSGFIGGSYTIFILGFVSGMVSIFCMGNVLSRLRLLVRGMLISIPALLCVLLVVISLGASPSGVDTLMDFLGAVFSGPVASAGILIMLPVFEAIFKKVSCFKYEELTDHKSRLIKRLITEAPGTFNHSIVVSNIAEACATAINEDAMLARTCAYYHDIGKLRRPEFFGENQPEKQNPHDELTPELSANIIKSHTQDGYSLVLKHGLPKEIADVCLEHHGTLPIIYFYDKAKRFTDGEVDITQYCYNGPKPQSKIAAIIMIADGCEAAARTLKDRSRENVLKVVRKIVDDRTKLGQFDDCEITMRELHIIIHTIVNNITGIYHSRVEYPKVNLKEFQ